MRARAILLLLGGALALGLLALACSQGAGSSDAQQGAVQNCPQAGKWAISVWSGDDGTDMGQALSTCGPGIVDAVYYLDPDTQDWRRYFVERTEISDPLTLDNMQGFISHGTAGAPPSTPAATPTATAPASEADKWALWTEGTRLRGANIHQRRVYPELDNGSMGTGPVGPPYTQDDFDRLAALGANYVNISHPGLFSEKPPYTLDQGIQGNLDSLLDMIAEADMFAVISFRTGPGRSEFTFFGEEAGTWFDESYLNDSVWQDEAAQDAWVAMWRHTAERYRNNPIVVGYDLMVEPNSNDVSLGTWEPDEFYPEYVNTLYDWNQLHPRITSAIREVDNNTPILIGGMSYSAVQWLPYLEPTGDTRTVYIVHQYEPFQYTHQPPPLQFAYPGEFDTDWDGVDDQFNRDWLDNLLSTVDTFKATHGVPLAVNEFGAVRWEPGAADFMDDQMELFEQRGMNQALWVWEPSWEPRAEMDDEFNFLHGPDPGHHVDVSSSDLIDVIVQHWGRNTIRPSSLAQGAPAQGTLRNCPQAGKWAISVWDGADDTETGQALDTCGVGAIDFAYHLDPQTQAWEGYFVGRAEISDLPTLDDMQGIIAHGAAGAPPPTSTPSPTPSPTLTASLSGGEPNCQVFPADNPWNTDISDLPVDPRSDAYIDGIGRDAYLHPDFGTVWEGAPNGIPYVIVSGDQPKVPVSFLYDDESDPGPYPIPPDASIEGGPDSDGDRHVIVIDSDNCVLYELWDAHPINGGESWEAGSGAIFDLSSNELRPDFWTSADAAGLPIFPGLVRYKEVVEEGVIDHALRFTVEETQQGFMHPATHWASDNTDPDLPPMGLRLRMKADYDCSGFSQEVQVICAALKTYGMFVADNGGNWFISGAPNERWSDDALADLKEITGDALEVVDTGEEIISEY